MPNTQKHINEICKYRDVPQIKKGQPCEVNGRRGKIWGGNSSANFNVKFDDTGRILNCHPYWKMVIFANDGTALYSGPEEKPAPQQES